MVKWYASGHSTLRTANWRGTYWSGKEILKDKNSSVKIKNIYFFDWSCKRIKNNWETNRKDCEVSKYQIQNIKCPFELG